MEAELKEHEDIMDIKGPGFCELWVIFSCLLDST